MATLIRRIAALEEERRSRLPEPWTPEQLARATRIVNRVYDDPIRQARHDAIFEEARRKCRESNG